MDFFGIRLFIRSFCFWTFKKS